MKVIKKSPYFYYKIYAKHKNSSCIYYHTHIKNYLASKPCDVCSVGVGNTKSTYTKFL